MNTRTSPDFLHDLPDRSGVYLMKDAAGAVLYVGKAKSLKRRVRSYFTGRRDVKTRILAEKTAAVETIITRHEAEAFLLENNLIKEWRPRYNIRLKDGKTYPVIRITNEEFPRVYRTRRILFDGSRYYGPFPRANQTDLYLDLIDRLFPLRKCRGPLKKRRQPCLNYHIGRCSAPCCGRITAEEYRARVEKIRLLLSGRTEALSKELKEKMGRAAEEQEFEKAARLRDQLLAVEELSREQAVMDFREEARDYWGLACTDHRYSATVFQMRSGKLIGREVFLFEEPAPPPDALAHFLTQYYSGRDGAPDKLYLGASISLRELPPRLLSRLMQELTGKKMEVLLPRKGRHARLVKMAVESSQQRLLASAPRGESSREALRQALRLDAAPLRIEGLDIAHLEGRQTVASVVTFEDGQPLKSGYRRYRIRSLRGRIDDYEAMREVVARRYVRLLNESGRLPDLILIDGGRGQVSAASSIMGALGLQEVPLAGLAKRNEEIYLPGAAEPLRLDPASPALLLLQAVRDEAHRFATTFHRRLRDRSALLSGLEGIPGIGPRRSRLLLSHYGGTDRIAGAEPEELRLLLKISLEAARRIREQVRELNDSKGQPERSA